MVEHNQTTSHYVPSGSGSDVIPENKTKRMEHLLYDTLYPADSYRGKVYWKAIPRKRRQKFIARQQWAETKRESKEVWAVIRYFKLAAKSPLVLI